MSLVYLFQMLRLKIGLLDGTDITMARTSNGMADFQDSGYGKHLLPFRRYRSNHKRYSVKKVFLKVLQMSQENTCVGVSL